LGRRKDGYHEIFSLLNKIDLYDTIFLKKADEIIVSSNVKQLYGEKNIVYKVASSLKKHFGKNEGIEIYIDKHIPIGSGLGGESSNAAYTLLALNKIWRLNMKREEMVKMSLLWGSDIPFFISANTALVKGRGEVVNPLKLKYNCYALIIFPEISISTKNVYEGKIQLTNKSFVHKILQDVFRDNSVNMRYILKYMRNDLEQSVFSLYPQLKQYKEKVEKQVGRNFIMSGSGSAFFTIFYEEEVQEVADKHKILQKEGITCVNVRLLC
jgi:4-diphosphocytidyl-2-C-methyl-D-erythritol kinase